MKIATWNVNSIRARLDRLVAWLGRAGPDVVCLQELKVADEEFPVEELRAAGYHAAWHGQRTYNGVAILAREAPVDVAIGLGDGSADDQARLIAATVSGVRFLSAYFPNGQVVGSDKWAYKLEWIRRLAEHLAAKYRPSDPLALCGDFNVAPEDRDVARPDEWRESVLCHPDARTALEGVRRFGLVDTMRIHEPGPGPYSWWDYRMLAFPKGNGLRIDHLFVTEPVARRCARSWVERDERKGKLPSDHAPVMVELADD
ncbi:MAG: exodeoxyribonuclease III [Gemmatimonadales bacterium]|nr:exodeoxyribonuclease III [Gemmatimonadales bacterium]